VLDYGAGFGDSSGNDVNCCCLITAKGKLSCL
jgi:hypothetical protein